MEKVEPGSAAEQAGARVGDVILSSNGNDAREGKVFPDYRPGPIYTLRLRRDGRERAVRLQIGPPRPEEHAGKTPILAGWRRSLYPADLKRQVRGTLAVRFQKQLPEVCVLRHVGPGQPLQPDQFGFRIR